MPWQERSIMTERQEFVVFARQEGINIAALCRQYGISRKIGYKWLERAERGESLGDCSWQLQTSPGRTTAETEARVLGLRAAHPA